MATPVVQTAYHGYVSNARAAETRVAEAEARALAALLACPEVAALVQPGDAQAAAALRPAEARALLAQAVRRAVPGPMRRQAMAAAVSWTAVGILQAAVVIATHAPVAGSPARVGKQESGQVVFNPALAAMPRAGRAGRLLPMLLSRPGARPKMGVQSTAQATPNR